MSIYIFAFDGEITSDFCSQRGQNCGVQIHKAKISNHSNPRLVSRQVNGKLKIRWNYVKLETTGAECNTCIRWMIRLELGPCVTG